MLSNRRSRALSVYAGCALLLCFASPVSAVSVRDFFYTPTNIIITAGDTVIWTNNSANSHDVTEGLVALPPGITRLFQTTQFGQNATRSWTFTNVGYYPYFCSPHIVAHPQQTGTVTVLPPQSLPIGAAITSPPEGRRFTNAFIVQLVGNGAARDSKLARLEFFANGNFIGSDPAYPYTVFATNLPIGTNLITAVAVDVDNLRGTSAPVAIVMTNIVRTNVIAMSGTAFSPVNVTNCAGSTVIWSNTQAIAHTAVGTNSLEPLCGDSVLLTTTVRCTNTFMTPGIYPFFCSIHPTMRGTVYVSQAASSPLVALTRPAAGAVLTTNGPIVFEASADDADGIGRVEFFRAPNTLLGQVAEPPFKVEAAGMPPGTFTFFARAIDGQGFGNISAPVTATFINAVPLQLLGATNLADSMQFDLTTTPGLTYVTERAHELPSGFSPFRTNVATTNVLRITDPIAVGISTQFFYRAYIK